MGNVLSLGFLAIMPIWKEKTEGGEGIGKKTGRGRDRGCKETGGEEREREWKEIGGEGWEYKKEEKGGSIRRRRRVGV